MRPALRTTLSCHLAAFALLCPWSASATTVVPLLFEELVLGADFVGIVECEQAGGIVAAYKVVESWKGPKPEPASPFAIAVNYWEPPIPDAALRRTILRDGVQGSSLPNDEHHLGRARAALVAEYPRRVQLATLSGSQAPRAR